MIYEENKTKYILVAVVVLAILTAIAFFYQQKTIMSLKKEIAGQNLTGSFGRQSTTINSPFTVKAAQKVLEENGKEIKGTIISKSDGLLKVEAEIVDFSKLSRLTEEELHQNIASFPKTKRNYEVLINDKTQFSFLKFEDLSEDMVIIINSSESVYSNDRINALKIVQISEPSDSSLNNLSVKSQIEQLKSFTGIIKEISDKHLIVSTNLVDLPKVTNFENFDARTAPKIAKEYKVLINSKTEFVGKKINELEVGSSYRFSSPVPIYSVSEFTAAKIE